MNPADLIIVGGGFGGLVAGVRARELGLSVVLLEQGEGDRYLCNSRMSGGIIHICALDIRRPSQELYDAIMKKTHGAANPAQAKALTENASRMIDWLQNHGTRFMRFNMEEAFRWCMAPPRALVPGSDWIGRGPDVALRELMQQFVRAGGQAFLKTKAKSLVMEDGVCHGVVAERDGADIEYRGKAVLIADGGFQADRNFFVENIGPNFDAVFQRGAAVSKGDGLRMATDANARTTSLRPFYGHLLAREARHNDKLWPYPDLDAFTTPGVIVGPDGKRIVNEGGGGVAVANALAHRHDPDSAIAIFDAAIWDGPGKQHRIPANPLLEQGGATIYKADTLEALAKQIEVSPEVLAETVAAHNAAVDSGDFSGLNPPREGAVNAMAIRTPPFMAIRLMPGITYTMGGIEIDGAARVVGNDGAPIQGLFAAGACTGGLEGGGHTAYIGGIVKAATFGLLAAEEVARTLTTQSVDVSVTAAAERFPMLSFIVRYGATAAAVLSPILAIVVAWLCWPSLGWLGIPAGAVVGAAVYVVIRSYAEIVTLITEMLVPR